MPTFGRGPGLPSASGFFFFTRTIFKNNLTRVFFYVSFCVFVFRRGRRPAGRTDGRARVRGKRYGRRRRRRSHGRIFKVKAARVSSRLRRRLPRLRDRPPYPSFYIIIVHRRGYRSDRIIALPARARGIPARSSPRFGRHRRPNSTECCSLLVMWFFFFLCEHNIIGTPAAFGRVTRSKVHRDRLTAGRPADRPAVDVDRAAGRGRRPRGFLNATLSTAPTNGVVVEQ